jgi:2-polyprenyl-3-methyl-5-hydroxy-6-metoxy-1,4-benzoquinol methylase
LNIYDYLDGSKLDTSLSVPISHLANKHKNDLGGRNALLLELVRDSSVIHIGCADHPEVMKTKIDSGKYLHKNLIENCRSVIGVDSDLDAINHMIELGFDPDTLIHSKKLEELVGDFDTVLVPDVIEHIPDLKVFLESLLRINSSKFVFSTPNGLALENRFRLRSEVINSDHIYLFSPYTLVKVLYTAGYAVKDLYLVDLGRKRFPIRTALFKLFPVLRGHLIVVAERRD